MDAPPGDEQFPSQRNSPALSAVTARLHSALDIQRCIDLNISLNEALTFVPFVSVLSVTHVCLEENPDAALPLFLDKSVFSTV